MAPVGAILMFAVVASCSGDGNSQGVPTGSATAATPATRSPSPSPIATSSATVSPTPTPSTRSLAGLRTLKSFNYTMHWEIAGLKSVASDRLCRLEGDTNSIPDPFTVDLEGTSVDPDTLRTSYRPNCIKGEFSVTTIAKEQWLKLSNGQVIKLPFEASIDDVNDALQFWDEGLMQAGEPLACATETSTTLNGIAVRHCQATWDDIQELAKILGVSVGRSSSGEVIDLTMDLWLHAEGNYPLRILVELQGKEANGKIFRAKKELNITSANDSSLRVTPPS